MHILHTLLYISWGADKENLFANQKVPSLVIISFILMTLMCDSRGICREKLDASHS